MAESQYAVIGLGRFGSHLAKELIKLGYEVLGIDHDPEAVDQLSDVLTHAVVADCTDENTLRSLGIRNFDCVIVAIGGDIQANIMTSILLKELGVKTVVAKAITDLHARVLERIGIEKVIHPERDMAIRVAHQLTTPNLLDYIELSGDYTIAELTVPPLLSDKTLKELNLRADYGISIVAINKKEKVIVAPAGDDKVEEGDIMVVIGTNDDIERFEKAIAK